MKTFINEQDACFEIYEIDLNPILGLKNVLFNY